MKCDRCNRPIEIGQEAECKLGGRFSGLGRWTDADRDGDCNVEHRHTVCPTIYGEKLTANFALIGKTFRYVSNGPDYVVIGVRPGNSVVVQWTGVTAYPTGDLVRSCIARDEEKPYDVRLGSRGQGVTIEVRANSPEEAKLKVLNDVEVHVVQPAS